MQHQTPPQVPQEIARNEPNDRERAGNFKGRAVTVVTLLG